MKVFIAFLLTTFVLGGIPLGRIPLRRPVIFAVLCLAAAASFYSLRVIE
jgi:hypothetical protein